MPSRKGSKQQQQRESPTLEVPEEFINGVDDSFCLNSNPDWLSLDTILPSLAPFPVDSDFYRTLKTALTFFSRQNGVKNNEQLEKQTIKMVLETIVAGNYDTEERYVWLISCVARIFLQKMRFSTSIILHSDVFRRYNCESLYCPSKMHQITKELYELTKANTFSIIVLVKKLNHINPVLHYICISLVSAGITSIYTKGTPENFQPLSSSDLIPIINKMNLKKNATDFSSFYNFLKLIGLYNSLAVMNKNLHETHPLTLVEHLKKGDASYLVAIQKCLTESVQCVEKAMAKKFNSPSLLELKQQILVELQYGLRQNVDEETMICDGI